MGAELPFRPVDQPVSSEDLLDACQEFADILADGAWSDPGMRRVATMREFVEKIGRQSAAMDLCDIADIEMVSQQDRLIKVRAEFTAIKDIDRYSDDEDGDEGEEETLEELFSVKLTVTEVIKFNDIPDWIQEQVSEGIESTDPDSGGEMTLIKPSQDFVDAFTYTREHSIMYSIDFDGEVDDYWVTVRFLAEDNEIDKSEYRWTDEAIVPMPTLVIKGKEIESVVPHPDSFEEEDIARLMGSLDTLIESIKRDDEFSEEVHDKAYVTHEEHQRRAMAILCMNAIGIKQIDP